MRTGSPQRAPGRHSVRQPPGSSPAGRRRYPGAVRLTVFWDKMRAQFGDAYAASVASDHALGDLGSRTVDQALAEGIEPKTVWHAVCEAFQIPERSR